MPIDIPPAVGNRLRQRLESYRKRPARQSTNGWGGYAAAAGAAVAGACTADAAIVQVTPPNPLRLMIDDETTVDATASQRLDIDGDGVEDLQLILRRTLEQSTSTTTLGTSRTTSDQGALLGFDPGLIYGVGTNGPLPGEWLIEGSTTVGIGSVRRLSSGESISASADFSPFGGFRGVFDFTSTTASGAVNSNNGTSGQFPSNGSGLAGFLFPINGQTHFGWIRVAVESGPSGRPSTAEVLEWAYEDTPGVSIDAGAVPEPTGLALLAAGAISLAARRRRDH